jgi:hypothetical protein
MQQAQLMQCYGPDFAQKHILSTDDLSFHSPVHKKAGFRMRELKLCKGFHSQHTEAIRPFRLNILSTEIFLGLMIANANILISLTWSSRGS